jgi:hypothetical protein
MQPRRAAVLGPGQWMAERKRVVQVCAGYLAVIHDSALLLQQGQRCVTLLTTPVCKRTQNMCLPLSDVNTVDTSFTCHGPQGILCW